jgi:hypothetical protein
MPFPLTVVEIARGNRLRDECSQFRHRRQDSENVSGAQADGIVQSIPIFGNMSKSRGVSATRNNCLGKCWYNAAGCVAVILDSLGFLLFQRP